MKTSCKEFLGAQFGGDMDIAEEIYAEYRAATEKILGDIEGALSGGDWALLDRLAHTAKGNALAVGDAETAAVAVELRGAAKAANVEQSKDCAGRLQELARGL